MNNKFKGIQWVIIIVLALVTLFGVFAVHHQGQEIDKLKDKKASIKVPNKSGVINRTSQKDVKKYQAKVEDKLDRFLRNDLKEGVYNYDNSGVNVIRTLFSPTGVSPVGKNQSQKKYINHYSDFDYNIKNTFIDKNEDGSADVYCEIETKYKGHRYNESINLIEIQLDKNGEMTGGKVYDEQGK